MLPRTNAVNPELEKAVLVNLLHTIHLLLCRHLRLYNHLLSTWYHMVTLTVALTHEATFESAWTVNLLQSRLEALEPQVRDRFSQPTNQETRFIACCRDELHSRGFSEVKSHYRSTVKVRSLVQGPEYQKTSLKVTVERWISRAGLSRVYGKILFGIGQRLIHQLL